MADQELNKIEELLVAGEYIQARHLADKVYPASEQERAWLLIVQSEAALYLGFNELESLEMAIAILRPTNENRLYARAKFLMGWALVRQGSALLAVDYLLEARLYFRRYDEQRNLRRTLAVLTQIAFQRLDVGMVEAYTEEIIDLCEVSGSSKLIALYKANLGRAYLRSGRLREASGILRNHEKELIQHSVSSFVNYHLSAGLLCSWLGKYSEARKLFQRIEAKVDGSEREKSILAEYQGQLALLEGNFGQCEKCLRSAIGILGPSSSEGDMVSQIKRLFGDLYVAIEKYDLAHKFTTEGLAVAEKINERVEIAACYRIFAQIANHRDQNENARDWFKKAIDLFSLISSRYELAVTRYLAATSGLYNRGERTAMLHLAREYFELEKVTPYTKKVDAALRSLVSVKPNRKGAPKIVAVSPAMKKLVAFAEHISHSEMNVLLTGPTGTGKDLFARYIHHVSGRKGEFVTVNAAAIPNEMIEAELFGHKKGAFTGASGDRRGLLAQADGGTFYLNEIADATPEFQAKLLEVLETRQIRRLGENQRTQVSFRLVAATNHDIEQRMKDNLFRLDLYHRLREIPITLPSLADRVDDIPALVAHFLSDRGFDANGHRDLLMQLSQRLAQCAWPGNVRELQAQVRYLHMTTEGDPERMLDLAALSAQTSERDRLLTVLDQTAWNRSEAARIMALSETTIRRRIKKYGLKEELISR